MLRKFEIFIKSFFSPIIDNFNFWFFVMFEGGEVFHAHLFWEELDFFSPSSEDPCDFFEWYGELID